MGKIEIFWMCFKMIVNYYSVKGCKYEMYKNRAVLFAPDDTDKELLLANGFIQLIDGRWCKYINDAELNYIMEGYPNNDVTFDSDFKVTVLNFSDSENQENQAVPNILSAISLWFAVIGFVVLHLEGATTVNPLYLWLIAVVFVIFTRVKYPKNIFSKVLAILYTILIIIALVLLMYTIILCNSACDSCMTECGNIPG